jgi:hypothetical protein
MDQQDQRGGDPQGDTTRGAAMRRALLDRVPALEYRGKAVLAALGLDQDSDLRGAIELDADAFLAPLASTTRGGTR